MSTRTISDYFRGASGAPPAGARVDVELAGPPLKNGVTVLATAALSLTVGNGIDATTGAWTATIYDSDYTGQLIRVRETINGAPVRSNDYAIPAGVSTLDLATLTPSEPLKPYTTRLTSDGHRVDRTSPYWGHDLATSAYAGFMSAADKARLDSVGLTALSGTYTSSLTGAVGRAISAKLDEVVSVKDFGAKGDGVTDDAAAIQKAIDVLATGATLYFPLGEYLLKGPVTFNGKTDFRVVMDGFVRTNAIAPVFSIGTSAGFVFTNCKNFEVVPHFRNTSSGDRGVAIQLDNCSFGRIVNGTVNLINDANTQNGSFLILRANVTDLVIANNTVRCGWGVLTNNEGGIARVSLIGNSFYGARGQGGADLVEFNEPTYGGSNVVVSGNVFANTQNSPGGTGCIGAGFAYMKHVAVVGNTFKTIGLDAVHVEDRSEEVVIANNIIVGCYNSGISISKLCAGVLITGNTIVMEAVGRSGAGAGGKVGIYVAANTGQENTDITIVRNFVDGVSGGSDPSERTSYALLVQNTDKSAVVENVFKNANYGIFLDTTTGFNRIERNRLEATANTALFVGTLANSQTTIEDNTYLNNTGNEFVDQSTGTLYRVLEYRDALPSGRKSYYRAGSFIRRARGKQEENLFWVCSNSSWDGCWRRVGEFYVNTDTDNPPDNSRWDVGEKMLAFNPLSAGYIGQVCTNAGTYATGGYTEGRTVTATGTSTVTLSAATSVLVPGDVINIGPAGANATGARILSISQDGLTLTLNKTCTAGSGLAIAYRAPTFKRYGLIT